jgi:hypothetical protein
MIRKHYDLIILSIIWIISIFSVIYASLTSFEIGIQNYIGYGLLIIVSILRYYKVKKFKTILGVLLILGVLNVIQFTYATMTFIFTWTPPGHSYSSFGFQPLFMILVFFFVIINFSDFMRFFTEDPKIAQERQKMKIEKLYDELKNEKDTKLYEIVENKDMYQKEYVRAAQRLIEERKEK